MNKEEIRFIDRLYKDLYLDHHVLHHGTGNKYDKFNNIKTYLEVLEKVHNNIGNHKELFKKLYYNKYVIKKESIPESYYEHLKKVAFENGFGYINIDIQEKQKEVIENQKTSLDTWLDYFLSEDSNMYPFWTKYWAFQGMLKLGVYDKEKGTFNKRTKETVVPFADLNREALALSIDLVIKLMNKEDIEDKELENLVISGSFGKIYSYVLKYVLKDNTKITKINEGKWIKYDQGSDHIRLVNSLKGYNTGWCTAGESTAKSQLENGDFYVYYTLDENGEYKVPRIAIRMEYGNIAEIRGVSSDQNLEPEMEEVVEEKIKDFPDKEQYYKKVSDMKQLTFIYKKHKNKEELTKEELTFLYEIYDKIMGFGYAKDPRIKEIINERGNKKENISNILNCNIEQVALHQEEIKENTIYYRGTLYLNKLKTAKGLQIPQIISGSLYLDGLTTPEDLKLPIIIGENLFLTGLITAKNLILPQRIGGGLDLRHLTNVENLEFPKIIPGDLTLSGLKKVNGLRLPEIIGGDLYLNSLMCAKNLILPKSISGHLILSSLLSAKGLEFPKTIGRGLYLPALRSTKGLKLPETIGGDLYLSSITSVKYLELPKNIVGTLHFNNLKSIEGLIIPEPLTYNIHMDGFTITPENIDQYRNSKKHI